jgi:DNA-directed RNA polymerase subunit omega
MSNMLPSPDILNTMEEGRFVLANLAAKRAKQIKDGAPPLVGVESNHPLTIALAEIAAGKIRPMLQVLEQGALGEEVVYDKVTEEPLPPELGMLLPALDESEVVLIEAEAIGEEESEIETAIESEGLTLSDLVDEGEGVEEAEPASDISEEDTLSLNEMAEEETSTEDGESDV